MHNIRPRKLLVDFQTDSILVLQVICHLMKARRKKTGKPFQYTLTILPPFLIPYARVTFSGLCNAISFHLGNPDKDLALNALSANDPRTFDLHFGRVMSRGQQWNLEITKWIIDSGKDIHQPEFHRLFSKQNQGMNSWTAFLKLSENLCHRLEAIGQTGILLDHEQPLWVHARLTYAGMGLGP